MQVATVQHFAVRKIRIKLLTPRVTAPTEQSSPWRNLGIYKVLFLLRKKIQNFAMAKFPRCLGNGNGVKTFDQAFATEKEIFHCGRFGLLFVYPSGIRAWRPGTKAQQPSASNKSQRLFLFFPRLRWGMVPFMAGRAGLSERRVPVPLSGPPTRTVCHPLLAERLAGSLPVTKEPSWLTSPHPAVHSRPASLLIPSICIRRH